MKAQRFERTKAVVTSSVIALFTALLVFSAVTFVIDKTQSPNLDLAASNSFAITSSISSSSSSQVPALLDPGATRYLWYTVHNSLSVPVTVNSLNIDSVSAPAGCAASNLDVSHASFTGALVVPAKVGATAGTNSTAVPISLLAAAGNQDGCKNVTFTFQFSGSAQYTEVYATSTAVASSQNPSPIGQSVTYTATVTGAQGAGQDPLPSSPTGKVTFKDGSTTICSNVTVTSASATTATAQCSPSAYSASGSHSITAVYSNTDGNFSGSTSGALTQVVGAGTSTALTSAPNPSVQGSTVTFTATVTKTSGSGTPSGPVSFFSGTPSGTHTLLGMGTLDSSGKATFSTSSLPSGANSIYAAFGGTTSFVGSTSPVITQTVIALPSACTGGPYNLIVGNPSSPSINGTNGNDFIYAPGSTNWTINGGNGNDCIQAGDGNNTITDGNGDNKIVAGNGKNTITAGNGANSITVGNGSGSKITAGNGSSSVSMGNGANNTVTLGNGTNTVTVQTPGNHNTITVGNGKNTAFLGGGTFNKFTGGKSGNTCHLPSLPASAYNHTLVNCTAVTP